MHKVFVRWHKAEQPVLEPACAKLTDKQILHNDYKYNLISFTALHEL